jgi:hypothetical protein
MSCGGDKLEDKIIEIFYIPLNSETFSAVTPENIALMASGHIKLSENTSEVKSLLKIIRESCESQNKGTDALDRLRVRAKIILDNQEYYFVDRNGVVENSIPESCKLNEEKLKEVDRIMSKVVKKAKRDH